MAISIFRAAPSARAAFRATSKFRPAAVAWASTSRPSEVTLPKLDYEYNALEPYISGKIMELHHKNHHQTYVNGLNSALKQISDAEASGDSVKAASFAPLLNFHGGGHTNHTLFWENLSPANKDGGGEPEGKLKAAIERDFGSFETMKGQVNTALAGIQGSGWAWLIKDKTAGTLQVVTRQNQDPVSGNYVPLMGIDAWEHAYYLQYENRKAEYFSAIWNVINWKTVAHRLAKA
ncbi:iron/manganese superoxide dismutase domain-containing protein [Xylariaceae sp. FL0255]|nr:iron/manganese superoxide dismutase domain-containing protein [Xylariaceae sp. FL0255]